MKSFFSHRHTRYTAIVMVLVWLMTLGIGVANACLLNQNGVPSGPEAHAVTGSHEHEDGAEEHIATSDKVICLKVCDAEQATLVKTGYVDASMADGVLPVLLLAVLGVPVVDQKTLPKPESVSPRPELPVSIRFPRLTI